MYKTFARHLYSDDIVKEFVNLLEHMETLDRLERENKPLEDYF